MISKNMYKILKRTPHIPNSTTFVDLSEIKRFKNYDLLLDTLKEAKNNNYIAYFNKAAYNEINRSPFYLTEEGQSAFEEYKNQKNSSSKSTLALIIAGLSFIASVIAIFISL